MSAQGVTLSLIYNRLNPRNDTKKDDRELNAGKKEGDLGFKSRFAFKSSEARRTAVFKTRDEVYKVLLNDVRAKMNASTPEEKAKAKLEADRIWKIDLDIFDRPITLRVVKALNTHVQTLEVSQPQGVFVTPTESKKALVAPASQAASQSAAQQIVPTLKPPLLSTLAQWAQVTTQQPSQPALSLASSVPQGASAASQPKIPAQPAAFIPTGARSEMSASQAHAKTKTVKNPAYHDVKSKSPSSLPPVTYPPSSGRAEGSAPAAPLAEKRVQPQNASLAPEAVADKLQDQFLTAATQKLSNYELSRFLDQLSELANVAKTHKPELLSLTPAGQFQPDLVGAAKKLLDYNQYMTPLTALHVQLYPIEEAGLQGYFAGPDRVAFKSYCKRSE